jgi:cytochrome c oxidase subunit 4
MAEVELRPPWRAVTALAIAALKTLLIMMVFMHLYYSAKLSRLAACAGLFWLAILIGLSLTDYLSRAWLTTGF